MSEQGSNANKSGRYFEQATHDALKRQGFRDVSNEMNCQFNAAIEEIIRLTGGWLFDPPPGVFSRQSVLCVSITEKETREDVLVFKTGWPTPLAIAVKYQDQNGSCDEKLEYLCNNVNERFPCPCVVLIAGEGWSPGAIPRVREWVIRSQGKVAKVLVGLDDLERWALDGFPYPIAQVPSLTLHR